jgi:hypothetical protein
MIYAVEQSIAKELLIEALRLTQRPQVTRTRDPINIGIVKSLDSELFRPTKLMWTVGSRLEDFFLINLIFQLSSFNGDNG